MNAKDINLLIYLSITFGFFWLEFFYSYKRTPLKDRLIYLVKDLPFAFLNIILPPILIKETIYYYAKTIRYFYPDFTPLFQREQLALTSVLIVGFIFSDFVGYALHRWVFHGKYLWFLHRTHHSGKVVRWHSSFRFNPIELCITTSVIYMCFFLVGVPFHIFYKVTILNLLVNYIAHSELPIGNKYIEKVLVTPNYHRIHHSVERGHQRSNFSGVFTWWDSMFKSKSSHTSFKNFQTGVK